MSRRKSAVKRPVLPDARYDSQTVSKFINVLMYAGKKATADFYLTYDSKKNNFGGGVDTSWTMGWKKTIAGSTFQRDFAIRTSFDFNMNTSTGDTRVTLGGSFKATNVGGGISCVFDTKEPSDIDCKGKYYFEKGAFEKSDTLSGL